MGAVLASYSFILLVITSIVSSALDYMHIYMIPCDYFATFFSTFPPAGGFKGSISYPFLLMLAILKLLPQVSQTLLAANFSSKTDYYNHTLITKSVGIPAAS